MIVYLIIPIIFLIIKKEPSLSFLSSRKPPLVGLFPFRQGNIPTIPGFFPPRLLETWSDNRRSNYPEQFTTHRERSARHPPRRNARKKRRLSLSPTSLLARCTSNARREFCIIRRIPPIFGLYFTGS